MAESHITQLLPGLQHPKYLSNNLRGVKRGFEHLHGWISPLSQSALNLTRVPFLSKGYFPLSTHHAQRDRANLPGFAGMPSWNILST